MMLKQFKIYFIIAAFLATAYGAWSARGWYEGNKEKEVIEKEVEVFNEQALKDQDELLAIQIELDKYKDDAEKLKGKAYEINKGVCNSPSSHANFNRLYNKAIIKANADTASKIQD